MPVDYDAVILSGGEGRRFGGGDKPGALVGGVPLIVRVAGAVADAGRLVVVGPARDDLPGAVFVREEPRGGGPVPALRAGLEEVRSPAVALLAADLPFLTAGVIDGLRRHDRAVLVDRDGRDQWLTGVWPADALREALAAYRGASLRGLLEPLAAVRVPVPDDWFDCDTPQDLAHARKIVEES
ncbi:molybdenum cofactor guanylyltransferase [Actinocorallia longicatena]|uniref:MobA-like NTP transferase domain-containing protein n=1 Tax=Actinocorallia longicatena TaxID=111803 RepID=A0ABP6Q491_9ACTN